MRAKTALLVMFLVAGAWLLGARVPAEAAQPSISGKVSATPAKYLGETVVYLKGVNAKLTPKTVEMDQKGMQFIPHVLAITVGDTVNFLNHDAVPHNVFSPEGGYNLGTWKAGETRSHKFTKPGAYTQLCSLHPEMLAFVFVGENPYQAVVGADGRFSIANVPPGTYQVAIWNSKLKAAAQTVTVAAGKPATVDFSLKR